MTGGAVIQEVELNLAVTRPAVRHHGGKYLLAPWLISNFPPHRIYCEPFCGGASVLLRKPRTYAEIINDIDGDTVNLFRVYRDRGDELRQKIKDTPYAREEYRLAYQPTDDLLERARRTIVRSYMGFGSASIGTHYVSGFRSDTKKAGTTPAKDWMRYPSAMEAIIERLRGVVIENKDFRELIPQHDSPETLTYADPPYDLSTRNSRHAYKHEFTVEDHCQLAAVLHQVSGMAIVSGYDCELYEWLYRDWETRRINTHADGASDRVETIWMNPRCSEMLDREPMLL